VGEALFAADRASREFMQMELVSCAPGRAVRRMTVREDRLNGHDIPSGQRGLVRAWNAQGPSQRPTR
jgi:acyl-CoA thioesterase